MPNKQIRKIDTRAEAVTLVCLEPRVLPEVLEFLPLSPYQRQKAAILWLIVMLKSEIHTVEDLAAVHEEARGMQMFEGDFLSVLVTAHVRPGFEFVNEYLKTLAPETITVKIILAAIYACNIAMLTHWRTLSLVTGTTMPELRELITHQAMIHALPTDDPTRVGSLEALRLGAAIITNKNPK